MCLLRFGSVSSLVRQCMCTSIRVQVCVCLYVQANEGGAPGVMPLFCHYCKWKVCLSMEKGLAQRCMQSFQARPRRIPGISAIIHCRGEKNEESATSTKKKNKKPKQKHQQRTAAVNTRMNCLVPPVTAEEP